MVSVLYQKHVYNNYEYRGETFRQLLLRIGEVRSLLPPGTHLMALTATATKLLRKNVAQILGMSGESVVACSPSKDNIMYTTTIFKSMEETFFPVAQKLFDEGVVCPRMIIYCRSYGDCADVYLYLKTFLGDKFTSPVGAPDLPMFRIVDMYMSLTEREVKDSIVNNFTSDSSLMQPLLLEWESTVMMSARLSIMDSQVM